VEDARWLSLPFSIVNQTALSAPVAWTTLSDTAAGVAVPWPPSEASPTAVMSGRASVRTIYTAVSQEARLEAFVGGAQTDAADGGG
jgi:hypothetical protein